MENCTMDRVLQYLLDEIEKKRISEDDLARHTPENRTYWNGFNFALTQTSALIRDNFKYIDFK